MQRTVFKNVNIFDGTGDAPFLGDVLVQDKRIVEVTRTPGQLKAGDARVIDGKGRFLMPGMTEAHTHFSWNDPRCHPVHAARGTHVVVCEGR